MGCQEYVVATVGLGLCGARVNEESCNVGDDGSVERIRDEELKSSVIEMKGANLATTYIRCPKKQMGPHSSLGINLPYLTVLMKNQGEQFSLEVQILDSKNQKRRFRASTFQVMDHLICFKACMSRNS